MNLSALFIKLKGSRGSGNYGHSGRPGKHGGSTSGGGLMSLGLDNTSSFEDRKSAAIVESKLKAAKVVSHEELSDHYNLNSNCKKTPTNCAAIKDYTDLNYSFVNKHLRGIKNSPSAVDDISAIDKELENLPRVPKTIRVKRTINDQASSLIDQMVENSEFRDKGYTSTSIDMNYKHGGKYELDIIVPKGSKGAYVEDITLHGDEYELLLPRNAKFRVLRNDHLKAKRSVKKPKIIIEYIGDE